MARGSELGQALEDLGRELWGEAAVEDMKGGPVEQDVVGLAKRLKRQVGVELASDISIAQSTAMFNQWIAKKEKPNLWQVSALQQGLEIVTLLSMVMNKEQIQWWFWTPNEYLAGFTPARMMRRDIMAVRQAANVDIMNQ